MHGAGFHWLGAGEYTAGLVPAQEMLSVGPCAPSLYGFASLAGLSLLSEGGRAVAERPGLGVHRMVPEPTRSLLGDPSRVRLRRVPWADGATGVARCPLLERGCKRAAGKKDGAASCALAGAPVCIVQRLVSAAGGL